MQRADSLYEKIVDYQEKVSGPEGENTREALERLSQMSQNPPLLLEREFEESARREMRRFFPQKADYVGKENLGNLIVEGREAARKYEFPSTRGDALMIVLKYAFGHGCEDDLLYPWIKQTLIDEKIAKPQARMERLEKKSTTWLEHVLKGSLGEAQL